MSNAFEAAQLQIKKQYGEGAVMRLGDRVGAKIDVISTGILSIDIMTGVGGIPRGRATEIFGPNGSGKTSLALHVVAEAQRSGLRCAYIDMEHALDPSYMSVLGVSVDDLLVSQPDSGNEALTIAEIWMRSTEVGVVVVDSVDCLIPQAYIDAEIGDSLPASIARLMSMSMRKLCAVTSRSNTSLIFINQLRKNIMQQYGGNETTTGGDALKYYASMRIDVRKVLQLKDGSESAIVGNRTKIKTVKNKVAAPFKDTEVDLIFGKGFSREADLLDLAVATRVVTKNGTWHSYGDDRIGQGRTAALAWLAENTGALESIKETILAIKGLR